MTAVFSPHDDTLIAALRTAMTQQYSYGWLLNSMSVMSSKTLSSEAAHSYACAEFYHADDKCIDVHAAWYSGNRIRTLPLSLSTKLLGEHPIGQWHFLPMEEMYTAIERMARRSVISYEWYPQGKENRTLWLEGMVETEDLFYENSAMENSTTRQLITYRKVVYRVSTPKLSYLYNGEPRTFTEGDLLVYLHL